jgi:hypothetical protein
MVSLLAVAAIAVGTLVAYAILMGYLYVPPHRPPRTEIYIQNITRDEYGAVTVIVRNVGDSDGVLSSVYIDEVLNVPDVYEVPEGSPAIWGETALPVAETVKIVLSGNYSDLEQIKVKVTRDNGSFMELTQKF